MKFKLLFTFFALLAATLAAAEKIVCTTYPVWLLTRLVVQNNNSFTVELMTPPHSGCAHGYTPLPGDLIKVKSPDTILIANGLLLDDHLIRAAKRVNPSVKVITSSVPAQDSHTFASPNTAKLMIIKIAGELGKIYPAHRQTFERNCQASCARLNGLIARAENLSGRQCSVIVHHKLFINLANLCGCRKVLFKHAQADSLRPADLIKLIRTARRERIQTVLTEQHSHDPALHKFLRESKCRAIGLDMLTGGSLQVPFDHYINTMSRNIDKLEGSLR